MTQQLNMSPRILLLSRPPDDTIFSADITLRLQEVQVSPKIQRKSTEHLCWHFLWNKETSQNPPADFSASTGQNWVVYILLDEAQVRGQDCLLDLLLRLPAEGGGSHSPPSHLLRVAVWGRSAKPNKIKKPNRSWRQRLMGSHLRPGQPTISVRDTKGSSLPKTQTVFFSWAWSLLFLLPHLLVEFWNHHPSAMPCLTPSSSMLYPCRQCALVH